MTLRVIWLAAALACSRPPPPSHVEPAHPVDAAVAPVADATPLDQDLPRLVERAIALYHDIATALAASGADCPAATGKLDQLAGVYHDVVVANARVLHDGRAKELAAALAPHGDAFDAGARAIMQSAAMASCAHDQAFTRALDALLEASP
jgi:CxxC motif-containing protein (DUF1111 family)